MMELCLKHHVLVMSDEIHSDLIFHGKSTSPLPPLSPEIAANVVTGISGTKTFNLAGLQASTVVFPDAHKKEVFDHYWQCMDIHRNNAFSPPPWRRPSTRARSGWSSSCPTSPPTSTSWWTTAHPHPPDQDLCPRRHLSHVAGLPGAGPEQPGAPRLHDPEGQAGPQRRLLLRPSASAAHAAQRRLPPATLEQAMAQLEAAVKAL